MNMKNQEIFCADKKFRGAIFAIFLVMMAGLFCSCKKPPTAPDIDETSLPVIWLDQSELSFAATLSGGNPASQIIKIKNAGPGTLDYVIEPDADWVSASPATGSSTGQETEHKITVNKTGLDPKDETHKATLIIKSSLAYNNPQQVTVNFTIRREMPPKIWMETQAFIFNAQEGGADPSAQNLKIKNEGTGTLNYQLSTDSSWLSVNPTSGSITNDSKSHQVLVHMTGLAAGTHKGKINVRDNNAANSPQTIEVTLNINKTPPPKIRLSTNTLAFTAIQGGADPPAKTFSVCNSGGGVLKYTVDWDADWVLVSPESGESGGADRNHTVLVNTGGLSAGSHQGTIVISDPHASNTPQQINVNLTVTNPPTDNSISISCSPTSAKTNTIVSFPVAITGNIKRISVFGLDLTFDPSVFQLHSIVKGSLTGSWTAVDGNEITSGTIRIGGFSGSASAIPVSSVGTIVIVKMKVISTASSNKQTKVWIKNYIDDIQGLTPSSTSTTFTYIK
jgi:hypothetical protein